MHDWIADLQELYSFIIYMRCPFYGLVIDCNGSDLCELLQKIPLLCGLFAGNLAVARLGETAKPPFLYSIRHKFRISKILEKITQEPEYKECYDCYNSVEHPEGLCVSGLCVVTRITKVRRYGRNGIEDGVITEGCEVLYDGKAA